MTPQELVSIRKAMGLSQAELAQKLGVSLRTLHGIENATDGAVEPRYALSALYLSMSEAVARQNMAIAAPEARARALDLAALIRGE